MPRPANHPRRRVMRSAAERRGSVLVTVLVVVLLLALGIEGFTSSMLAEREATAMFERDVQARASAESGIEWAAAVLTGSGDASQPPVTYDDPDAFREVLLLDGGTPRTRARFTILAADESDPSGTALRYGLLDESSRFPLDALPSFGLDEEGQRDVLMKLPNMTIEIADAILDWLDDDETPRPSGAENEYYGTLEHPYEARNGPLRSLDELLRVRGVTPELLWGEDRDRDGLLDPEEDADGNGVLDRGWQAHLTVDSREANHRADGSPRIDVNADDLETLYDDLRQEFDEETAKFVVAYRLYGPSSDSGTGSGSRTGSGSGGGSGGRSSSGGRSGSGGGAGGGRSATSGTGSSGGASGSGAGGASASGGGRSSGGGTAPSAGGTAPFGNTASAGTGASSGTAPTTSSTAGGASGATPTGNRGNRGGSQGSGATRGGLDLSGGGSTTVASLYDLVGTTVRAQVDGRPQDLTSPWRGEGSSLAAVLPKLFDVLSTTSDEWIEGRVNASQASRTALLMIPGMTESQADAIVGAHAATTGAGTAGDPLRATSGWLLVDGHVDLETMRTLAPYLGGRGGVYRAQVVGHFDAGGPAVRVEATIDATQRPPRVTAVRDLGGLGRGYSPSQLAGR